MIMFYKIVHQVVAIPCTILIPSDRRTRKNHDFTYRHIAATKDTYKFSFFPYTITQWNLLPSQVVTVPTVEAFREQLTPAVLSTLM